MQAIINTTGKIVKAVDRHGNVEFTFKPSEYLSSIKKTSKIAGGIGMFNFVSVKYGKVVGLPDPAQDTYFIVSAEVKDHSDRPDLITPDGILYNEYDAVIVCRNFRI